MATTNGSKRKWQLDTDLIPTFSDSDDIPDLDAEAEDVEASPQDSPAKANSGKKRKAQAEVGEQDASLKTSKKGRKRRKQEVSSEDEDETVGWADKGEDDGAFDPAFEFDAFNMVDDVQEGFDGWNYAGTGGTKSVGVDEIIQRRREKNRRRASDENVPLLSGEMHVQAVKEEKDSHRSEGLQSKGEDEELLADDAFGMGAEAEDGSNSESERFGEDGNDPISASERPAEGYERSGEDSENSEAEPVLHPDDLALSDHSGADESDAEERAKHDAFFAASEPSHKELSKTEASFQSMQLSRPLLKGLAGVGFTQPTPIQSKTVPVALLGKDVVGGAVTGSGKTAAFVLPILERLLYRPKKVPTTRVSILTPTRELAVQCHSVATKLAQYTDITFALIVGGLSLREQEATLKKRPDVVIATPGRFIDHMRNSASFAVDNIEILILDEADRMLEDGFADELNELLKTIPRSRQTMLFSATMTSGVDDLIRAGLDKPVRLVIDAQKSTVPKLVQEFVKIKGGRGSQEDQEHRRLAYLLHLCTHPYTNRTIIFIPTKHLAHRVKILFSLRNVNAAELHGSMSQEQRLGAIVAFREGRATHLLATDLASRGLDIPRVETVINYTVPTTSTTYLHRVGRTARAGRGGVSVTIFEGSKTKSSSTGPKGKGSGKQTASERALLRPILKIAKTQKAPMRTRALPPESINNLTTEIATLQNEIEDIVKEEKEERLLQQTERDMAKSENMLKHEDEIKNRPRRTWFQSERDKKAAKEKGVAERLGAVGDLGAGGVVKKTKKQLSNKDKKRMDARAERLEGKGGVKAAKGVVPKKRSKHVGKTKSKAR